MAKEGYEIHTTITPKKTLQEGKPITLKIRRGGPAKKGRKLRQPGRGSSGQPALGVGEIYEIIVAERWSMPRTSSRDTQDTRGGRGSSETRWNTGRM